MGVNELYAIPSCQYSGYLDVKHPAGNRGKVAFRVWKRRYVVLNSMTNTLGAPEAKLEIYLSQDEWMAGRGRVPLLPQKPAWIRRCYSRTRAFAFKIQSSTGVVLLYLAGSDETDSQTWMRELRSIYWPRDMKVQPEFLIDSTEISIIDNNFTEQLGLCGSFWLRVGHSGMTLYEPGSEEPRYAWRLRELRRYFVARTQNEKDRNKVFCFTACDANDERSFVFFLQDAESLLRRIEKAQSDLFSTDMPKTSTENLAVKTSDADDDEVESRRSRSNTDSTTISDKSDNSYSSCKNWNNPSARNTMCNTETTGKRWKQSYDYLIRFSRKNPDWRMSDDSHISEDDAEGPLLKEQHSISQWSLTLPRDRLTSAESSPDFGEIGGKFRNQEQGSHGPRRGSAPNNSTRDRRTSGYSNISSSSERPISEFGEYLDMTGIKDDEEKPKMESGYLEMSGNFKTSPPQNTPENGTDNITATGLNPDQLQLTIPQTAGRSPILGRGQDEEVSDDDYVPFDEESACAMSNLERRESESSEANFSFSSESGEYEFQESPIFRAKKLRNSGRRKTTRTKIIDELYAPLNDQFDNLTGNIDSLLRESRPKTASPAATEAVEDIESSNEYGAIFTQSPIRLRRESKEPQSSLDSGIIVTSSGSSCSTSTQSSRSNSSYTDENQKTSEWTHDENMYKVIPQTENHYELEDCGQTRHRSDSEDSDTYSIIRSRGNTLTGSDGVYECPSDLIQIQENENILDEDDAYVIFDGDEEETEVTKAPPLPQTPIPETPPKAETEMGHFERQMSVTSVSSSNRDSGQSIASGWSVVTSDDVEEIQGSIQNRQRRSGAFSGSSLFMDTYPPKARPKLITTQHSLQPCEELLESSERSSGESTASEGPERVKKSKDQKKKKSTWTRLIQSKIFSKKDDSERERKRSKSHAAPPDEETEAIAERSRRRSKSDTPPTLHRVGSKTFVKESTNPAVSPTSPPVSLRGGSKSSVTFQTPPPVPPRESIPKEIHHRSQSLPDPPDHDYHVNTQKRTTSYPPPPVPPRPSRLSNELKSPPPIPERVFISASHDFKTTQILPNGDKIPKRFTRSPSQDCGKPSMIRSASEDQGQSQFFPFPSQDLEISRNSDVFHSLPRSRPPPSLPVEASNHVITISKDGSELLDLEPRVRGDSDASVASYASLETVVDALGRSKE